MRIHRVEIENFRTFYGREVIDFAEKGITLVTGENGIGKSSLLNAITWCLYGRLKLTKKETKPELVNFYAIKKGKKKAKVRIFFSHQTRLYRVQRTVGIESTEGKVHMESRLLKDKGSPLASVDHWSIMNSILPEEIHDYFFFSGEAKSEIDARSGGHRVREAIYEILGMKAARQAIEYLEDRLKYIANQRQRLGELDEEAQSIKEEIEDKIEEKKPLKKQINTLQSSLDKLNEERIEIIKKLRDHENLDVREIQKGIEDLESKLEEINEEFKTIKGRKIDLVRDYSWSIFGNKLFKEADTFVKSKIKSGDIPGKWKKEIVIKSLDDLVCKLCKRPFDESSAEFKALSKAITEAVSTSAQERIISCNSKLGEAISSVSKFKKENQSLIDDNQIIEKVASDAEKRLKKAKKQIKDIDTKEVGKLQDRLEEIKDERDQIIGQRDILQDKEEQLGKDQAKLEAAYKNKARSDGAQTALAIKEAFVSDSIVMGKALIEEAEKDSKERIKDLVSVVIGKCFTQEYQTKIDDDYKVSLIYGEKHPQAGREVDPSGGEYKFLNIAFVIALSMHSRERIIDDNTFFVRGSDAPLVIDAPYGELAPNYIRGVTTGLMNFSEQLVLFVKPDHMNAIRTRIDGNVEQEYVLNGFIEKKDTELEPDTETFVTIGGNKYNTLTTGSDFVHTEIKKVS